MTMTHVLEYPVDIAKGIGEERLQLARKEFEKRGWNAISWGVDSHDALEFTIYRLEDEREVYVSLFLAINENGILEYALEALIENKDYVRKVRLGSGTKDAFRADDITTLLDHAVARLDELNAVRAPLLAAVGAADLAIERVNDMVLILVSQAQTARSGAAGVADETRARLSRLQDELPGRLGEFRRLMSPEELRKFAERYAEAVQSLYADMVDRGENAVRHVRDQIAHGLVSPDDPSVSDLLAKLEASVIARQDQPPAGTRESKTAPAKKAPAKKLVGKAAPRKASALARRAPAKKVPGKKLARQSPKRRG